MMGPKHDAPGYLYVNFFAIEPPRKTSGTGTEIAQRSMSQTVPGPQMPCRLPETFRQASGSFRKVEEFFLQLRA